MTPKRFLAEFNMPNSPKTNSAKNHFDVIISTIYIKYLIQNHHLSIGYHI